MLRGRLVGVLLAVCLTGAGCASTAGRGSAAAPPAPVPVTVDPAQIFNDVPQSP